MVRRVVTWLSVAGTLAVVVPLGAQQVGPDRGALVLVGGAMQDAAILDRFLTLAGGPEAPIVLVPTAGGAESYGQDWPGAAAFRAAGASRLTVLHTSDRATADTEAFSGPIREAGGVWFGGGRQWRPGRSPPHPPPAPPLPPPTRRFDMVEVIRARPELLGIGIDEDTAIVVRGDTFEVIGSGYVAIYDHALQLDSGAPFYFLSPGDAYDLAGRQAYRTDPSGSLRPLDRVVAAPWSGTAR